MRVWTGGDRWHISIYAVDGSGIRALRYATVGAMTLPFALFIGGAAMMLIWVICWIGIAIVRFCRWIGRSVQSGNE